MARQDLTYARVDVDFPLHDKCLRLGTATHKWAYMCLWLMAVKHRRSYLHKHRVESTWRTFSGISPKTSRKSLAKLHDVGLITLHEDGAVTVHGVRSKHNKLDWNDDSESDPYRSRMGLNKTKLNGNQPDHPPSGGHKPTQAGGAGGQSFGGDKLVDPDQEANHGIFT